MILNERTYRITKAQADKFRTAIADASSQPEPAGVAPRAHRVLIDAMSNQLATLEAEMAAFDRLKSVAGKKRLSESIDQLGLLLIQARIARGFTQRQLGDRLGLHMQKIQQYEATGYARASATRIREVLEALGAVTTVQVHLIDLPAPGDLATMVGAKRGAAAKA